MLVLRGLNSPTAATKRQMPCFQVSDAFLCFESGPKLGFLQYKKYVQTHIFDGVSTMKRPPKLCHHKKKGYPFVYVGTKQVYLGRWGSIESRHKTGTTIFGVRNHTEVRTECPREVLILFRTFPSVRRPRIQNSPHVSTRGRSGWLFRKRSDSSLSSP